MINRLHTYVEETAARFPDHVALTLDGKDYTYARLMNSSVYVWKQIYSLYLDDSVVAVFGSRRYPVYYSILGILRSGNAYCPLNPKFPAPRNTAILRASQASMLIGDREDAAFLEFTSLIESDGLVKMRLDNGDVTFVLLNREPVKLNPPLAYLLFTSGTTGTPKGVGITHDQVCAYISHMQALLTIAPGDRCSHTFDLTFDLSVHDLFVTWSKGATLCIPGESDLLSPARYIKEYHLSCWFSVPSLGEIMRKLRQLKPGNLSNLKTILFCGEALPYALVREFRLAAPDAEILNLYGPTEATIAIAAARMEQMRDGIAEIGTVFPGHTYLISERGELLLSGPQVIRAYFSAGYENRFEIHNGRTYYKTGDIVEESSSGLLYKGRLDEQVKYKGYRIELGEIEQAASTLIPDRRMVCLPRNQEQQIVQLILAVEGHADDTVRHKLQEGLRAALPSYMVPEIIRFVEKFPLNSNGKTDKKAILDIVK